MPELKLSIEEAHPHQVAQQRGIALRVHLAVTPPETHVYSLSLAYEVQVDAVRRPYRADEQRRLVSVFGPTGIWYHTLHSLLWGEGAVQVPAFIGQRFVELWLPLSGAANPTIEKYLTALSAGDVLLVASFSGTAFCASDHLPLQMCPLPENCQTTFRLPLARCHEAMALNSRPEAALELAN